MPRTPRRPSPTGLHHVMNRGVDHQAVFFDDRDRLAFGRTMASAHDEFGIEFLAYCLMGNHFHLLVRAEVDVLSRAMHHLGTAYTRRTNDRVGRDGPLFRGRFHSIPVDTDPYLLWVARYIHRNPIDQVSGAPLSSYRWSSYPSYVGRRCPPPFLDTATLLDHFDGDPSGFAHFTEEADEPGCTVGPSPGRPRTALDVTRLVECAIALDDLHHGNDEEGRRPRTRSALLALAISTADDRLRAAIIESVAFPNDRARRTALSRTGLRLRDDPTVQRVVRRVLAEIEPSSDAP